MSTEALLLPLSRPSASPRQSASRYNTLRGALPASWPRAVECSCAELKDLVLQTQRITGPHSRQAAFLWGVYDNRTSVAAVANDLSFLRDATLPADEHPFHRALSSEQAAHLDAFDACFCPLPVLDSAVRSATDETIRAYLLGVRAARCHGPV